MAGEAMAEAATADVMAKAVKEVAMAVVKAVETAVGMASEAMAEAATAEAMAEAVKAVEVLVRVMKTVVEAIAEAVMAVEKAVAVKVMAKAIGMAVEMVVKMVGEAIVVSLTLHLPPPDARARSQRAAVASAMPYCPRPARHATRAPP